MFLTNMLLKKAKSRRVMVLMESVVTGYKKTATKQRIYDKLEVIAWDPYIRAMCVFKEKKRIRSL